MNATVGSDPERLRAQHFTISAFDVPVSVHISGSGVDALADHLRRAWDWCEVTEGTAEGTVPVDGAVVRAVLDADPTVVRTAQEEGAVAGTTLLEVGGGLVPAVTTAALAAAAGDLLLLHAAAVADLATGATVVLAGVSGSGKSTASRLLGQTFGYLTDETVALDAELGLHPYPKPLSLFPPGRRWGKEQHSPASLGLQRAPETLHLAGVLLLQRAEDGPASPELIPIPVVDAVVMLGEHTSYLSALDHPLHRLADLARTGTYAVRYRSAEDLVPVVRDLMAMTPAATHRTSSPSEVPADRPDRTGTGLVREPLHDLYRDGDVGVAFLQQRLIALSPMAVATLDLVQTGVRSAQALSQALAEQFGEPEEGSAHALTAELVNTLVSNGLLSER